MADMEWSRRFISIAQQAREEKYYQHPIPSEMDETLCCLVTELFLENAQTLSALQSEAGSEHFRILGLFAERMASLAVRQSSIDRVKEGLMALVLYSQGEDLRDVLLVLSVLHDACLKTGVDPAHAFDDISTRFGGIDFVEAYLKRADRNKSIQEMGYFESQDRDGFVYKRNW